MATAAEALIPDDRELVVANRLGVMGIEKRVEAGEVAVKFVFEGEREIEEERLILTESADLCLAF